MNVVRRTGAIIRKHSRNKHTIPTLRYQYEALEPAICRDVLFAHHNLHQIYIDALNKVEANFKCALAANDVSKMIALQPVLRFNMGGHINHSIFWKNLSPCSGEPGKKLNKQIQSQFGSFESLKQRLIRTALGIDGSGWAWLGYCPKEKKLTVTACTNEDMLQVTTGIVPLFGIDVFEHAYYKQYRHVRDEYVNAIFDIMNWRDITERYDKATEVKVDPIWKAKKSTCSLKERD